MDAETLSDIIVVQKLFTVIKQQTERTGQMGNPLNTNRTGKHG